MAAIMPEGEKNLDDDDNLPHSSPLGNPVIALFDGLPLQNHNRLAGRLIIDDPDDFESNYNASSRRHGTAMASLIVQGDLGAKESPLSRYLYVRPILRPNPHDFREGSEIIPESNLVVDLIHRAVRRLYEEENNSPAVGLQICAINLSIGIRDRLFDNAMSPLARLLDWLSWKYKVLFIVSAGNHAHPINFDLPLDKILSLSPEDLQTHVIQAIASDTRNRRLLSPAEGINILTIGAVNDDASSSLPAHTLHPYIDNQLPSIINAHGMGYRRAIKPDILVPGGKIALKSPPCPTGNKLDIYLQGSQPGQLVAAPGNMEGDLAYTWFTRGTSNATALATRLACHLYDIVEDLRKSTYGNRIEAIPDAIILKALLVHGSMWGQTGEILKNILHTPQNSRQFKEYLTRLIGYGIIDSSRIVECAKHRVTALGGGFLQKDQAHIHTFPLPPSLSGKKCFRRLIITLAWITPINSMHQAWRRAHLWFSPPMESLKVSRKEADWHAVQRGTVQHEIMEGEKATAYVDGDQLTIQINCRADAGVLEQMVPYTVAITLEMKEDIDLDIYAEVSMRIHSAQIGISV